MRAAALLRKCASNDAASALGIFALSFASYVLLRYPGPGGRIWFGDSAVFQFSANAHSLGHPTGYPQYLAIIRSVVALVPFGEVEARVDAVSGFFAALALAIFFRLGRRLGGERVQALLGTLGLGLSHTFFLQATEAEVYALNSFWFVLCLDLWTRFLRGNERALGLFAVAYGLSLGNHQTMILLAPVVVATLARERPKAFLEGRTYAWGLLAVGLCLAQYAYTYALFVDPGLEYSFHSRGNRSFDGFVGYSTGRTYHDKVFVKSLEDVVSKSLPRLLDAAWRNGVWLLSLGLFGVARSAHLRRSDRSTLLGAFAVFIAWGINYDISDIVAFYTPAWIVAFLGLSVLEFPNLGRVSRFSSPLLVATLGFTFWFSLLRNDLVRPKNELLAEMTEYVRAVPPGASLVPFGPSSAGASLLRYLEKNEKLEGRRVVWKVTSCVDGLYFLPSSSRNIRAAHDFITVGRLSERSEDLRRMRCRKKPGKAAGDGASDDPR